MARFTAVSTSPFSIPRCSRRCRPSLRPRRWRGAAGYGARLRILSGRLFDNGGNRMSPTHANKGGARYRYYVSQAVLQGKPPPPGLVSRVPAAEIEALVVTALRNHLNASGAGEPLPDNDHDLLERHLERVTLTPNHLELRLRQIVEPAQAHDPANNSAGRPIASVTTMAVPWTSPVPAAVKGIIHVPAHNTPIKASHREAASDRDRQRPPMDRRFGARPRRQFRRALPGGKERSSSTSGCWRRSPSSRPGSCRHCSRAPCRPASPSPRLLARCPGPGPSSSGVLDGTAIDVVRRQQRRDFALESPTPKGACIC